MLGHTEATIGEKLGSSQMHVADCDGTAIVDRATRRGQRDMEPYLMGG